MTVKEGINGKNEKDETGTRTREGNDHMDLLIVVVKEEIPIYLAVLGTHLEIMMVTILTPQLTIEAVMEEIIVKIGVARDTLRLFRLNHLQLLIIIETDITREIIIKLVIALWGKHWRSV